VTPYFTGQVRTEWLKEDGADRRMLVLERFAFTDSHGFEWSAEPGEIVNGASIPTILWSLGTSPYIGEYRRASVLHDVACHHKIRTSRDVHRMFYDASRADGIGLLTGLKMYAALRLFGPQWDRDGDGNLRMMATVGEPSFEQVEAALDAVVGPHGERAVPR
jgi:hypothetical protein